MNKIRRKTLEQVYEKLADIRDILDEVRDEEECAKDNLPESLEGSERYESMEEAVENLEDALSSIEDALDYIESAMEK